jgi:hypothetical protein
VIVPKRPKLTERQEKEAYAAVTLRDQGRCVRCGATGPVERDHRQNRDPYNTVVSNLQLLGGPFGCGCHLFKTEHPAAAVLEGFAVPRWARPEVWPAWRYDVGGWVIYLDAPDEDGKWWQEIKQSTADLLMRGV